MLLQQARDRLTADLRQYFGVRLQDMYAGHEDVLEVAAMAVNLPRGSSVMQWLGGWQAISGEEEALRRVEFILTAVNTDKKHKPKPPKPPESIRERDAKVARTRERLARAEKAVKALG